MTSKKIVLLIVVLILGCCSSVNAKSMYLIANHHTAQFDAWDIGPSGSAAYQATYLLSHATDPAGIAHHNASNTLFVTSEFSAGVEMVNATTMTSLGVSSGPYDLGGVDIDDDTNVLYAIQRQSSSLYAYDFNPVAVTLTLKGGFPISLPSCSQGMGISLDTTTDVLWVADAATGVARAYNINTWTEIVSKSFTPSHQPVDVEVDRVRQCIYTVSMDAGASVPYGTGSDLLSRFDLIARTEWTVNIGHRGVGVAVDEDTGFVYVTGSDYYGTSPGYGFNVEVYNYTPTAWVKIQETANIGTPAGICIPRLGGGGYSKLNLQKGAPVEYVKPGDTVTFTLSFDNTQNPTSPVTNVVLEDFLPSKANFVSASDGGTYDAATRTVTWNVGNLAAGASTTYRYLTVTIDPTALPGEHITNQARINAAEPNTGPTTVTLTIIVAPPTVESCNELGVKKDVFVPAENVSAYGSGYQPLATYNLYIEPDGAWSGGEALTGTPVMVETGITGDIPTTTVWNKTLTAGKFDIIVDVNGNGVYDAGIDALDDNDVVFTAGFLVIPEYWLGTVLGLAGCLAAFGTFRIAKRKNY